MKSSNLECSNLSVIHDKRFKIALKRFNSAQWYPAHDAFEDLWHESNTPERNILQGLLQIAVAQFHLKQGNTNGATILFGEALGRLKRVGVKDLGLDIGRLCNSIEQRLLVLQNQGDLENSVTPFIHKHKKEI